MSIFKLGLPRWLSDIPLPMQETRDRGSIPGSGRSPGIENGSPLHILAWKIPWSEEPGGLQSMGSQESDTIEHLCTQ